MSLDFYRFYDQKTGIEKIVSFFRSQPHATNQCLDGKNPVAGGRFFENTHLAESIYYAGQIAFVNTDNAGDIDYNVAKARAVWGLPVPTEAVPASDQDHRRSRSAPPSVPDSRWQGTRIRRSAQPLQAALAFRFIQGKRAHFSASASIPVCVRCSVPAEAVPASVQGRRRSRSVLRPYPAPGGRE